MIKTSKLKVTVGEIIFFLFCYYKLDIKSNPEFLILFY